MANIQGNKFVNFSVQPNITFGYYKSFNSIETDTDLFSDINKSVVLGFLIAMLAVGIVGNTLVIYLIASDRTLHKAPFYFLVCISVTDLSKTIFCLPFILSVVYHNFTWSYGDQACTVLAFANSFFTAGTAIGLLAVVIDRYFSVTAPQFYSKCSHGLVNLAVIILGWGISFCLSFPPIFEKGSYRFIVEEMQCSFHHRPYRVNDTLGYTVSFVFVLFIILFLNCRLFLFMRSHRRMAPLYHEPARSNNWTFFGPGANGQALINLLNGFTGGPPNPFATAAQNIQQNFGRVVNLRVIKNEHLTRLFAISSFIYIILWIPYLYQVFTKVFRDADMITPVYSIVSTMLSHSHVAICPFVYLLFGSPIRMSVFTRSNRLRHQHTYMGVSDTDTELPEPNVRCIELEV